MDKTDTLKITYRAVDEIIPYANNARQHSDADVDAIMESIKQFGFNDPIGIWKGIIVEGHGRLIAAKRLGMKEVPCIDLDHLTDEERKAYALAHNKTAELSGWNFNVLDAELKEICDIDMSLFGFNADALEFGSDDDYFNEQNEPEVKEGKKCTCPSCGFEFEVL